MMKLITSCSTVTVQESHNFPTSWPSTPTYACEAFIISTLRALYGVTPRWLRNLPVNNSQKTYRSCNNPVDLTTDTSTIPLYGTAFGVCP